MSTGHTTSWTSNRRVLRAIAAVSLLIAGISLTPLRSAVGKELHAMVSRTHTVTRSSPFFTASVTAQNPCAVPGKRILRNQAYEIQSPRQYAASGGTVFPAMLRTVETEPNLHYVVVYGDLGETLDCRGAGRESDTEIGINEKKGTRLFAMSWQPLGGAVRNRPLYPQN